MNTKEQLKRIKFLRLSPIKQALFELNELQKLNKMIETIRNTKCAIVNINVNVDINKLYNTFQIFDDTIDDLKIYDNTKSNEVEIDLTNQILLTNNRIDSNRFTIEQSNLLCDLSSKTDVFIYTDVDIQYYV